MLGALQSENNILIAGEMDVIMDIPSTRWRSLGSAEGRSDT